MSKEIRSLCCQVCKRQMMIMKRCTRCRSVMYCVLQQFKIFHFPDVKENNSQECQREDWPTHKQECGREISQINDKTQLKPSVFNQSDGSIFHEEHRQNTTSLPIHTPLVNFSKALSSRNSSHQSHTSDKKYLHNNEFYTDIPDVSDQDQLCEVTMKYNKVKNKLKVQKTWSGAELFKFIAYSLSIPLENIKLIHKGKVLTVETVMETVQIKAVYQIVGEKAECEDNIDQRDISVMMEQCGIDRNKAIQRLRSKGDLLDALLDQ